MKKRGLGRDLSALLGTSASKIKDTSPAATTANENTAAEGFKNLPVEQLARGRYQPRTDFNEDHLQELAESIRTQGIIQPIVVRKTDGAAQHFEIIAGERRWRAAQLAGLHEVPVIVRDLTDEEAVAVALIENIQREDLNPIEEATALHRLIEEFGLTHQEAADAVGRSRTTVSNLLRLLTLDTSVKQRLEQGEIEMGHGRALLSLEATLQAAAARHVAEKGLSVRETEAYVRRLLNPKRKVLADNQESDPHVRDLQNKLSTMLGAKVICQHSRGGRGKLVIQYNSLDELDGILEHIK